VITRTYVDSGVVIAAFGGESPSLAERAIAVLEDENREIVASDFVWLEIVPKTRHHGHKELLQAYLKFFENEISFYVLVSNGLVKRAMRLAGCHGLGAMDALHLAAALEGKCDEFVTTEKPTKPFFRVSCQDIRIDTIYE